ncbi:hypothetical protein MNV49_004374 [Pseudohyphozyma bogoriensis]|nr:hypothetical protein MNV49_004374 [Pseudohyphozyma bogoriensis]
MFLVNRLFGGGAATPAPELLTIDGGQLYLLRPDSIKGGRECIFIDASITIRRTTHDYAYQLVVTRAFQEGEEQLLEEDAENSDERSFLLDSSLFLSLGQSLDSSTTTPSLSITWLDPDGDGPDDEFEFVLSPHGEGVTDGVKAQAEAFEVLAWRCMWERREGRSWPSDQREAREVEATLEEEFKVERTLPTTTSSKAPLFRDASPTPSLSDTEHDVKPVVASHEDDANSVDSDDDSDGDEIAAALTKVSLNASSSSPAPSTPAAKDKGKGRAGTPSRSLSPPAPLPPASQPLVAPVVAAPETTSSLLLKTQGDLHLYDQATGTFVLQAEDVTATVHESSSGYWLLVEGKEGQPWVSQEIASGQEGDEVNFSTEMLSMVFNFTPDATPSTPTPQTFTWLIRFGNERAFTEVHQLITKLVFEVKNGKGSWAKMEERAQGYVYEAFLETEAIEGEEVDMAEQEEEEEEVAESEEESEEESEDEASFQPQANKAKNSQLAVGYKDDMSFVVQGDMIGVFKQNREGRNKINFVTSIVGISTPDGKKGFTPSKVMLHNQDTSMILQNSAAPGSLFRLDLETGKVVDEYKVSNDFAVKNFLPDAKFAQTTQQQTFIGLSNNGVFRIDPRLAGSKLANDEFKQYATKNDFSVATTTESGRLAVASNKGDIRLFDKLGKNAKTALPALGDPIIGMDVSADGRWLLATTKKYILLVDTLIPEGAGKYAGSSGFDRSFPAAQKPTPKILQLRPEHVAFMQEQSREGVSFTPAKFNAGLNETERTIVSSSGPFVIAWNFRHVKNGNTSNYTIRRFSETVIADAFKFGGDREIIVTLPTNVLIENKKGLKAPTRDSISGIVNEWRG